MRITKNRGRQRWSFNSWVATYMYHECGIVDMGKNGERAKISKRIMKRKKNELKSYKRSERSWKHEMRTYILLKQNPGRLQNDDRENVLQASVQSQTVNKRWSFVSHSNSSQRCTLLLEEIFRGYGVMFAEAKCCRVLSPFLYFW